jgi:hypothetical protein
MPLPSSTAVTTSTGCAGLTVEQALIAASWPVLAGAALAETRRSEAVAIEATPAPVIRELRFIVVSYETFAVAELPAV